MATTTSDTDGPLELDRSNPEHQKKLRESYIFNVGVGNSRRHDLFPGNKAFWEWVYAENYFQNWMTTEQSRPEILSQVVTSWQTLGGGFFRFSKKEGKEYLSFIPLENVLTELHKRFTTTKSNMVQPRKKKNKSVWNARLDQQQSEKLLKTEASKPSVAGPMFPYTSAAAASFSSPVAASPHTDTTALAVMVGLASSSVMSNGQGGEMGIGSPPGKKFNKASSNGETTLVAKLQDEVRDKNIEIQQLKRRLAQLEGETKEQGKTANV